MTSVLVGILAAIAGGVIVLVARTKFMSTRVRDAETRATRLLSDAEVEVETKTRQSVQEVRDEISAMRREAEDDVRLRREEVQAERGAALSAGGAGRRQAGGAFEEGRAAASNGRPRS